LGIVGLPSNWISTIDIVGIDLTGHVFSFSSWSALDIYLQPKVGK
jgi:hypothetical protein